MEICIQILTLSTAFRSRPDLSREQGFLVGLVQSYDGTLPNRVTMRLLQIRRCQLGHDSLSHCCECRQRDVVDSHISARTSTTIHLPGCCQYSDNGFRRRRMVDKCAFTTKERATSQHRLSADGISSSGSSISTTFLRHGANGCHRNYVLPSAAGPAPRNQLSAGRDSTKFSPTDPPIPGYFSNDNKSTKQNRPRLAHQTHHGPDRRTSRRTRHTISDHGRPTRERTGDIWAEPS